ncbi:MAG TPA: putative minor capsid protein [Candidatus Limiplasma sp.]|nr:putative minor capsid protein [Candidatus Limiplasma sp.]HPS80528.1 putative minor capsid protein [Candidatus Limiplasma sp.]
MRPLPRALLCHSATLSQAAGDAYGTQSLNPVAQLTHIRIEPMETLSQTNDNRRVQPSAKLWFDAAFSRPAGVAFRLGDYVTFQGKNYTVETITTYANGRRLHHIEIDLTG